MRNYSKDKMMRYQVLALERFLSIENSYKFRTYFGCNIGKTKSGYFGLGGGLFWREAILAAILERQKVAILDWAEGNYFGCTELDGPVNTQ